MYFNQTWVIDARWELSFVDEVKGHISKSKDICGHVVRWKCKSGCIWKEEMWLEPELFSVCFIRGMVSFITSHVCSVFSTLAHKVNKVWKWHKIETFDLWPQLICANEGPSSLHWNLLLGSYLCHTWNTVPHFRPAVTSYVGIILHSTALAVGWYLSFVVWQRLASIYIFWIY